MALPPEVEVIQATLAPAFLISGASVFLNFAQNRLFRVVDRIRNAAHPESPDHGDRKRLLRRAHVLRNGIAFGVLTVAFTVTTAILVMAGELFGDGRLLRAAPYFFALALLALLTALVLVFSDTVVSVRSVDRRD